MIRDWIHFVAAFWLSFCVSSAWAAGDAPDVSAELAVAQKAWNEADRLGGEARDAVNKGDADKSLNLYKQQDAAYNDAESSFRKALDKDPNQSQVLVAYGRFAISRNQFVPARARLRQAVRSPRADTLLKDSERAAVNRTLGGLAERAGDVNHALLYYNEAEKLCPSDPRNPLMLAIALCSTGRSEKAVGLLASWTDDKASGVPVQDAPLRALGVYTLAVAQEETGRYEDALNSYERARDLAGKAGDAENTGVLDHATMALERLNDFFDDLKQHKDERERENEARVANKLKPLPDERAEIAEALSAYDEGLDLKEKVLEDETFIAALARARREGGDEAARNVLLNHSAYDQFQAAINRFNFAIARYPRLPQACYQLGLCHLLSGNYKDARRSLETAITYSPYNYGALTLLGEVLLETGQGEQAETIFKKVLAQNPDSGPAHFGLARALFDLQRNQRECESALIELDRAEELGVRDKLIYTTQVLLLKDGTRLEGRVHEDGGNYVIELTEGKSQPVAKADVQELTEKPGLRDRLSDRIKRFERGEPPAQGPKLKGRAAPHAPTEADPLKDPWATMPMTKP